MRTLLIQAAQTILRRGGDLALAKLGRSIFFRKGHRNIAVAAIARKLVTQIWHLLRGNRPDQLEPTKHRTTKLKKLVTTLGKVLRTELKLGATTKLAIANLNLQIHQHQQDLLNT